MQLHDTSIDRQAKPSKNALKKAQKEAEKAAKKAQRKAEQGAAEKVLLLTCSATARI